jgi:type IV secretion system protein VirB5
VRLRRLIQEHLGRWSAGSDGSGPTPTPPPPRLGAAAANPFLTARNEFANAFSDLAQGKRNWQVIAYALMGLVTLVTIAYVRLAQSARVVPYVVQVDRLGQVVAVGTADELKRPDQRLVASQLAQFVRAIRTVLPAPAAAAEAELLRRGYAFVAPQAAAFLNDYFARPEHDPRVLGTRLTRQVEVASVLRLPHSDVWRLQWTETERATEPDGSTRTVAWEGYVSVKLVPPSSAEVIQENPLGLSVTSISWTQVAESAPTWPTTTPGGAGPASDTSPDSGARP